MAEIYLTSEGEYLRVVERRGEATVVFDEIKGGVKVVPTKLVDEGVKVDWSEEPVQFKVAPGDAMSPKSPGG